MTTILKKWLCFLIKQWEKMSCTQEAIVMGAAFLTTYTIIQILLRKRTFEDQLQEYLNQWGDRTDIALIEACIFKRVRVKTRINIV